LISKYINLEIEMAFIELKESKFPTYSTETPADIVFSISELRKYIFDFACTYSDKKCAEKGLWNVLQLRLKPNSSVSLCIWFYAFNSNAESFLFWMAENGIQIEYLINYAAENGNELGGLKWPFEGR